MFCFLVKFTFLFAKKKGFPADRFEISKKFFIFPLTLVFKRDKIY